MTETISQLVALSFTLKPMLMLILGVISGLVIGAAPGIGSLFGLTLILPFTAQLDVVSALALLIGFTSVTATSDTLPAVMIGVPGTAAAIATVEDGHPLARQGKSRMALGAAYSASMLGGIFGAIVLAITIPVLRPVILTLQSPDFLAVSCVGLFFVALVSGAQIIKGLISVLIGLCFSLVGLDQQTGSERFTFGQDLFWDGLSIAIVFIGLFGLPEIADIMRRGAIEDKKFDQTGSTTWDGMRSTLRHWRLVLASSSIGTLFGAIPGIGVTTIDWIAYGLAKKTDRKGPKFGTGNIRGVIAPESANNAKEGGNLIPTLALGIPGSVTMVFILAALTMQGIAPGPKMLTTQLPLVYTIALYIAIANIMGTAICLAMSGSLSRLALAPVPYLVPVVVALIALSSFKEHLALLDICLLMLTGIMGMIMKHHGWSRPAFALGFVLGPNIEHYYSLSTQLSGYDWITRPSILAVTAVLLVYAALSLKQIRQTFDQFKQTTLSLADLCLIAFLCSLAFYIFFELSHGSGSALQFPMVIAIGFVGGSIAVLLAGFRNRDLSYHWPQHEVIVLLMIALLIAMIHVVGMPIAAFCFAWLASAYLAATWRKRQAIFAALFTASAYFIFNVIQHTSWPAGILPHNLF